MDASSTVRSLTALRLWVALLGGMLLGAGLVLHGQIAFAHYVRDEVERTFFLWRAIAEITFVFQSQDVQLALGAGVLPPAILRECDRAAWALVVIGLAVAASAPLLRRRRRSAHL